MSEEQKKFTAKGLVIILALFVGILIGNFTAPNEPRVWCNDNMPKGEIGQCRAIEHWNVERDAAKKWQEAKNTLEDETAKLIDERMKITCKEYGGLLEECPSMAVGFAQSNAKLTTGTMPGLFLKRNYTPPTAVKTYYRQEGRKGQSHESGNKTRA